MESQHCMLGSTLGGANGKCAVCSQDSYYLQDEKGYQFPVATDADCRFYVFNSRTLCIIEDLQRVLALGPQSIRIEARLYDDEELSQTVKIYRQAVDGLLAGKDLDLAASKDKISCTGQIFYQSSLLSRGTITMNKETLNKLEFNKIQKSLADLAYSEGGKQKVLMMEPSSDLQLVQIRLDETAEAMELLRFGEPNFLNSLHPVDKHLKKARVAGILMPAELLDIYHLLRASRLARKYISNPSAHILKDMAAGIIENKELENKLLMLSMRMAESAMMLLLP